MNQVKFIEMANQMKPVGGVEQTADGNTIVHLRDNIDLIHNYKRKDEMSILFKTTNERFYIPDNYELEHIYREHLGTTDVEQVIYQHAVEKYKKVE